MKLVNTLHMFQKIQFVFLNFTGLTVLLLFFLFLELKMLYRYNSSLEFTTVSSTWRSSKCISPSDQIDSVCLAGDTECHAIPFPQHPILINGRWQEPENEQKVSEPLICVLMVVPKV